MIVRTAKGKMIDMGQLIAKNEKKIAIGNANMNARGDIIEHGQVVRSRESIVKAYNNVNPKAVKQVSLRDLSKEVFVSPEEAVSEAMAKVAKQKAAQKAAQEAAAALEEQKAARKRKIEDKED